MIEKNSINLGRCEDLLSNIEDQSINLIILDPPYGTTPLEWDKELDFNFIWEQYNRVTKEEGVILIFGQEPFSSHVRLSNENNYKYDWYWEKERLTNVFQVKRRPGKTIETISVFYNNQCKYFPQKSKHKGKIVTNKVNGSFSITLQGNSKKIKPTEYRDDTTRHPTQVLRFNRDNNHNLLHPTQKPLELYNYLIKTYTEENDLILDNCSGSGTTAISCLETKRNYICIEKDLDYYTKSIERVKQWHSEQKTIFDLI